MVNLSSIGARFIPLIANGKKPAGKFKDKSFTREQLVSHINHGGNLGLLAQPNFVFIDIDSVSHGKNGVNGLVNFSKWISDHGMDLETLTKETLVQGTPSGGLHLIFLKPKGYQIAQDISFLPGVDIKASPNNYIVVHPSKINGKPYEFLNDTMPTVLPQALADALTERIAQERKERRAAIKKGGRTKDGLVYRTNGKYEHLDVFYNVMHGFEIVGARNNALFTWACAVRRFADVEEAIYFARIANKNSPKPLADNELVATVKSAFNYSDEQQIEIATVNGVEWVYLKNRISAADHKAVLKSVYDRVQSPYSEDYNKADRYSYSEADHDASSSQKKTIWNYQPQEEGQADDTKLLP